MAAQQMDQPGQRVGGGVLAGQQHRQHVAGHLSVVDAAAAFVGSGDHRFEQVRWLRAPRRVGVQRCRACAMKPPIASFTAATLRSSRRSAGSLNQRQ